MLFRSAPVRPLFSKDRASLAAGLDYAAYSRWGDTSIPTFKKEFEVGLYGAYVLTPHLTLTGSAAGGVDNKLIRYRVGVRTVIWSGK